MIIGSCPTMIEMLVAAEPTVVLPKIAERAVMGYSTVAQHHSAVNKLAERTDIMQHHEYSSTCRQPRGQHIGKQPLVLEVNPRGGFVQDEELGVACKRPRDQHPLLLPAGQRGNVGVELFGEPNEPDGVMDRFAVVSAQRSEGPSVCQASGCDNLFHLRTAEQRHRALRNITNARPLPEAPQGQAEQAYRAALVGEEAEQGTDQGGFSGAVASQQSHGLSGPHCEADAAQYRQAAQFDREIVGRKRHWHGTRV